MSEKTCDGNCLNCSPHQRLYCTAQMCLNIISKMSAIENKIESMSKILQEIQSPENDFCKPETE